MKTKYARVSTGRSITQLSLGLLALAGGLLAGPATPEPEAYVLGPQDKLSYFLKEDPRNLNAERLSVEVGNHGQVSLPINKGSRFYLNFAATGKTLDQLRQEIQARLKADYYDEATVELALESLRESAQQVTFFGDFQSVVYLGRGLNTNLAQAIKFHLPSEFANLHKVRITRVNADGTTARFVVDVTKILSHEAQDVPLHAGDLVEVPKGLWPTGEAQPSLVRQVVQPLPTVMLRRR